MLSPFLLLKGGQALEQADKGSGGVTNPGSMQNMSRCGISQYGLAGMVVFSQRLGSMILEVFFNFTDSMISWFYDIASLLPFNPRFTKQHRKDLQNNF